MITMFQEVPLHFRWSHLPRRRDKLRSREVLPTVIMAGIVQKFLSSRQEDRRLILSMHISVERRPQKRRIPQFTVLMTWTP